MQHSIHSWTILWSQKPFVVRSVWTLISLPCCGRRRWEDEAASLDAVSAEPAAAQQTG